MTHCAIGATVAPDAHAEPSKHLTNVFGGRA